MFFQIFLFFCAIFPVSMVTASMINAGVTEDLQITASPPTMHEGLTSRLDLNCSFLLGDRSDFSDVMSIILYKMVNEQQTEIASISSSIKDGVVVKDAMGANVTGRLRGTSLSYILYRWTYPAHDVIGKYKCEAFGIDELGHPRTSSAVAYISYISINYEVLIAKTKDLEVKQALHQDQLVNHLSLIQSQTTLISQQKTDLDDITNRMNGFRSAVMAASMTYQGHAYFLSRSFWRNAAMMDGLCRLFGGYLAEINNKQEYDVIYNLMKSNNVKDLVHIGGSEKQDGAWHFQRSDAAVTYFNWAGNQPGDGSSSNCLALNPGQWPQSPGMNDVDCQHDDWGRFVCEVPT